MKVNRILVTGLVAGAAAWAAGPAAAQTKKAPAKDIEPAAIAKPDQADLDRSQIIGNRELPKVTYIVPWKKPGAGSTISFAGAFLVCAKTGTTAHAAAPATTPVKTMRMRLMASPDD